MARSRASSNRPEAAWKDGQGLTGRGDAMNEREWNASTDPAAMLRHVRDRGLLTERKARLFAAACCRRHWGLLDEWGRRAVEAAERHADGNAREEWPAARGAFLAGLGRAASRGPAFHGRAAVSYLLEDARPNPAGYAAAVSAWAAHAAVSPEAEKAVQASILRDLFGPQPFRRVAVEAGWLAWNDRTVAKLASAIYDERAFDRMPVLADALEEAGCSDDALLGHLRGPGLHWLGCFALDAILGKG
jgi:hypothetical protein